MLVLLWGLLGGAAPLTAPFGAGPSSGAAQSITPRAGGAPWGGQAGLWTGISPAQPHSHTAAEPRGWWESPPGSRGTWGVWGCFVPLVSCCCRGCRVCARSEAPPWCVAVPSPAAPCCPCVCPVSPCPCHERSGDGGDPCNCWSPPQRHCG